MQKRLSLNIASQIDAELVRELGEGIDLGRMLGEALYARDVLLVCDAFAKVEDSNLAELARQFRLAMRAEAEAADRAERAGPDSSGFSPSRFFNSLFGAFLSSEQAPRTAAKGRQRGALSFWRRRSGR